jgi:glycosyltransferase involved in cell wall biosynthesis
VTHARGEIICLLDADDIYLPEKVSRVVEAFTRDPKPCLVYHQLQAVSADGQEPLGSPMPRGVLEGNIRRRVERAGGWWPRPTTSALSFARPFLEHLLPIPPRRNGFLAPDTYLAGAAPFYGSVVGLAEPFARLRLHGENRWTRSSIESSSGAELFRLRRDQYVRDIEALQAGLRERLGIEPRFSLEDHFRYQQYRRGAGEPVSLAKVVTMALRCPTLPWSMRWREAVKVSLGRW